MCRNENSWMLRGRHFFIARDKKSVKVFGKALEFLKQNFFKKKEETVKFVAV